MDISTRHRVDAAEADLRRELIRSLAMPVGGGAALVLAVALIPVRSMLSRPLTLVPFVVLVIAVSLVGGAWSGCVTAVVAGLAFDSFLHEPYGVLSLDQWAFWSSTGALVVLAIVTGRDRR